MKAIVLLSISASTSALIAPARNDSFTSHHTLRKRWTDPVIRLERVVDAYHMSGPGQEAAIRRALRSMIAIPGKEMAGSIQEWSKKHGGADSSIDTKAASLLFIDCIKLGKCGNQIVERSVSLSSSSSSSSSNHALNKRVHFLKPWMDWLLLGMEFMFQITHLAHNIQHELQHHTHPISFEHIVCGREVKCFEAVLMQVDRRGFRGKKAGTFLNIWLQMTFIERSALIYAIGHRDYLRDPNGVDEYENVGLDNWEVDSRALILPLVKGMGKDNARAMFDTAAYVFGMKGYDLIYFRGSLVNGEFDKYGWPENLRQRLHACTACNS